MKNLRIRNLLQPETKVLLIIVSLIAMPMRLGANTFPAFGFLLIGGLIWEDAKKAKQVNPYAWKRSWQTLGKNRWFVFILMYSIWVTSTMMDNA
jgi:hypothetical protein